MRTQAAHFDAGPLKVPSGHLRDSRGCESAPRQGTSQEQGTASDFRPGHFQIPDDGGTNALWKREASFAPAFPCAYQDPPFSPVDVLQVKVSNFAAAEAKARQEEQDGLVADAHRVRFVHGIENPRHVVGGEMPRERRQFHSRTGGTAANTPLSISPLKMRNLRNARVTVTGPLRRWPFPREVSVFRKPAISCGVSPVQARAAAWRPSIRRRPTPR